MEMTVNRIIAATMVAAGLACAVGCERVGKPDGDAAAGAGGTECTANAATNVATNVVSASPNGDGGTSERKARTGRDCFNAPIDFDNKPYMPYSQFSNGVAKIGLDGETWTIIGADRPLYRFGRYECGFVRQDRPDGRRIVSAALFFGGALIAMEAIQAREDGFGSDTDGWHVIDYLPEVVRQFGGQDFEAGALEYSTTNAQRLTEFRLGDVNQMILRHRERVPYWPTAEHMERLRQTDPSAFRDIETGIIHDKACVPTIDERCELTVEASYVTELYRQLVVCKFLHAKSWEERLKYRELEEKVAEIQRKCIEGEGWRGSHYGITWGEGLRMDLLGALLLGGEAAECWEVASSMKGRICGWNLEFELGFALKQGRFFVIRFKGDEGDWQEGLMLFKVSNYEDDFVRNAGFVYVKVEGEFVENGGVTGDSYQIPYTFLVKVDGKGKIVKYYPWPKHVKTVKEFWAASEKAQAANAN